MTTPTISTNPAAAGNPAWTVNNFQAAVCISIEEFDKIFKGTYDSSDRFPKSWKSQQEVSGDQSPKWKLDITELGPPGINFAANLKNGINVLTEVKKGTFQHLDIKLTGIDKDGNPTVSATWQTVKLDNIVSDIETRILNIDHVAGKGETTDENFSYQPVDVDMSYSKMLSIVNSHGAPDFNPSSGTKQSLCQVLEAIFASDTHSHKYWLGQSKLPLKQDTAGELTPRALRVTLFQDPVNINNGSVNWNILMAGSGEEIPELPVNPRAGAFNQMPIPKDTPGLMILSFQKILEDIILPRGFESYGLTKQDFTPDAANAAVKLGQDVTIKTDNIQKATFVAGNTKISPDVAGNRLRADMSLENIQLADSFPKLPEAVKKILDLIPNPKFKATWTGYITFSLNNGNIEAGYSQDTPVVHVQDGSGLWKELGSIVDLGLDDLARKLDQNTVQENINGTLETCGNVFAALKNTVDLPSHTVLETDRLNWDNLGLQVLLKVSS